MSDSPRRWGVPLILLLALAAAFVYQRGRMAIELNAAARSPLAPAVVVRGADGALVSLADRRGDVVVVSLWADWCGPCRREVPRLSRLRADYEERGLALLAINADGLEAADLLASARGIGIDYPVFAPVSGLGDLEGGSVLPFTWLIDRQGRVRAAHGGIPSEASLRRACTKLLEEPSFR